MLSTFFFDIVALKSMRYRQLTSVELHAIQGGGPSGGDMLPNMALGDRLVKGIVSICNIKHGRIIEKAVSN